MTGTGAPAIEVAGVCKSFGGTVVLDRVDTAYRAKYGRYGGSMERMVTDDAAASTLRFMRA